MFQAERKLNLSGMRYSVTNSKDKVFTESDRNLAWKNGLLTENETICVFLFLVEHVLSLILRHGLKI